MAVNETITKVKKKEDSRFERAVQSPGYGYREIQDLEHDRLDVLEQLRANLAQLEELQGHLRFVMSEVRGHIVK